jgi:hypothetical protein
VPVKIAVHAPSLYLDTSVIGGYFDKEFMGDTRALWKLRDEGRFRFIRSVIVDQEIAKAPENVRKLMRSTFSASDVLPMTFEVMELASHYLASNVVPLGFADDAGHVAMCSVSRTDHLVSWNFKHLANVTRESGFNAVNLLQAYPPVRIVAPTFLIYGHEEKTF